MRALIRARLALFLGISLGLAHGALAADDACSGFTWDVAQERALFASSATSLAAGADSASAPSLVPGRLYALQLQPQARVTFLASPGRKVPADGTYAGLANLQIATPGAYRVAVDIPFWIDVVADGGLMTARGFQGTAGCNAPHKIVAFDFPVARQVTLQFSGAASSGVRVSITAQRSP